MRFMTLIKANEDSDAVVLSDEEIPGETQGLDEEPVKAGAIVAGEGSQPRSEGIRVRLAEKSQIVIDGPFAETKN